MKKEKISKFKIPHVYAILIGVIIITGFMTYIIPAGTYERIKVDGVTKIDPNSFQYIKQVPVSVFNWFKAIPEGFASTASIIATMLVGSACFGVYTESGVFQNFINNILKKDGNNKTKTLILIFMSFFAIRSGFTGILDGNLVFTPLMIGFALAAGYDTLTGVAIVMVPTFVSFSLAPVNPYTILIAHEIVGLPIYSGFEFRLIIWIIGFLISAHHILKYADAVKKDKNKSLVADIDVSDLETNSDNFNENLTLRQKALLFMLLATIVFMVIGAIAFNFKLNDMTAILIISGIIAGIIAGYDSNEIATKIIKTGKTFYMGSMCVVLARAVQIILTKGMIVDTIVHSVSIPLEKVGGFMSSICMFFVQLILNFFINSGSGKAVVTMPIMSPLADLVNVTQQTAVLAFQFGDGITNMIYPTSGLIFAFIAMGKISYEKYVKYIFPLVLKLIALAIVSLIIATLINYGPF